MPQKYRLSSNLKFLRILIILFIIVFTAGWINSVRLNIVGIKKDGLIELPVCVVLGLLAVFLINRIKWIEFDSDLVYIHSKRGVEAFPIKNVSRVKIIMIEIGGADFYKMDYITFDGEHKTIRFLPTENFIEFKRLVKENNKNFSVKQWTHSFDWDRF